MVLKGFQHPNWKGGCYLDSKGYRLVLCENGEYRREHRIIMEKSLGRPLKKGEIVHHKNGDKLDNQIENLVLHTNSEHTLEHWQDGTLRKAHVQKKEADCLSCQEFHILYAKGLCRRCYYRRYMRQYVKRKY